MTLFYFIFNVLFQSMSEEFTDVIFLRIDTDKNSVSSLHYYICHVLLMVIFINVGYK